MIAPATDFVIDVWAHLDEQRETVIKRALEAATDAKILIKSKGPERVRRGAVLTARLSCSGLVVSDPTDAILWDGQIGNATFAVQVLPADAEAGPRAGLATVHIEGLRIARLDFLVRVGKKTERVEPIEVEQKRHRSAFASYADADRDAVLARVQGMQKESPMLEVFMDVLSLRSGQYWERELWRVIPTHDVFYLFWSASARKSIWVGKEWRCALKTRGLDFIDPVPLVNPKRVPPPEELSSRHFNDWVLAFISRPMQHRKATRGAVIPENVKTILVAADVLDTPNDMGDGAVRDSVEQLRQLPAERGSVTSAS